MSRTLKAELELAWKALEESFHVRLIGTFGDDLVRAPADAPAGPWLNEANPDFDQFPVRAQSETIGILVRQNHGSKLVAEAMQPLAESLLVSADMPITRLISQLGASPYRLVLRDDRVDGLVTQSDLLKLPVRLVLFGLITHLEQVMAEIVTKKWGDEDWIGLLSEGRQAKISGERGRLAERKMNPPLIELTQFADKRCLCQKLLADGRSLFKTQMKDIQELRDQLAHASTYVGSGHQHVSVPNLVAKFENARRWMDMLGELSQSFGDQE